MFFLLFVFLLFCYVGVNPPVNPPYVAPIMQQLNQLQQGQQQLQQGMQQLQRESARSFNSSASSLEDVLRVVNDPNNQPPVWFPATIIEFKNITHAHATALLEAYALPAIAGNQAAHLRRKIVAIAAHIGVRNM